MQAQFYDKPNSLRQVKQNMPGYLETCNINETENLSKEKHKWDEGL